MVSSTSSTARMKVVSTHWIVIAPSLRLNRISVFLKQKVVHRCLISRPDFMYIPHMSQWGSGYFPSCNTTMFDQKGQYIKCSCSLTVLWSTNGHPGTRQYMFFNKLGKDTTYLAVPPLPLQPSSTEVSWSYGTVPWGASRTRTLPESHNLHNLPGYFSSPRTPSPLPAACTPLCLFLPR